jgi:hypothetical protein
MRGGALGLVGALCWAQAELDLPRIGCLDGRDLWGVPGTFVLGEPGCRAPAEGWLSETWRRVTTEDGDFGIAPDGRAYRLPNATETPGLEVLLVDGRGAESPAGALVDAGTVAAGDYADTRMRIRNNSAAPVALAPLRINGVAFALIGTPTGPQTMAPGTNVDFRVRFQPRAFGSYSATLAVNDSTILFRGNAPAGLSVSLNGIAVTNTQAVDFGRVEVGLASVLRFSIRNDSSEAATIQSIRVSPPFEAPSGPMRVGPGETAALEVRFAPTRAGVFESSLDLDQRSFRLQGVGAEPPVPEADLLVGNAGSGQQANLVVRFRSPVRARSTVLLRLTFEPAAGAGDDPGVQFLASAGRSLNLVVNEGETSREVQFQTGTTAGLLGFRLESGRTLAQTSMAVPAALVRVTSSKLVRSASGVDLELAGFDNIRTVSEAQFTFSDRDGRPVATEPIRVRVADAFAQHFRESRMGGVFLLRASFPVSGDATRLGAVQVELANSVGPTRIERIAVE